MAFVNNDGPTRIGKKQFDLEYIEIETRNQQIT